MGCSYGFSSSSYDEDNSVFDKPKLKKQLDKISNLPNPKPNNYSIIESKLFGKYLIVKIIYHDCTNYEGVKIMVYKDCTIEDLINQKLIDPHFSESNNFKSPIARFEPTDSGWDNALTFVSCKSMRL